MEQPFEITVCGGVGVTTKGAILDAWPGGTFTYVTSPAFIPTPRDNIKNLIYVRATAPSPTL